MVFAERIHNNERRLIVAALIAARKDATEPVVVAALEVVMTKVDRASELAAVIHADDNAAHQLEAKAVVLIKKYGRFLPGPAKDFFRELAGFLNWEQLKKEL